MVTSNITDLYCNIPHEHGKQAVTFKIEKYLETLHPRFSKNFILDDIELTLNNISF